MKRKSTFLRMFALLALMLPWTLQAQNAKVSEYDSNVDTLAYSSIVNNGGTAWTAADSAQGYVDVAMPFGLQFGENAIASGATLRVYPNGSAEFTSLSGSSLAPLRYSSGYNVRAGASVYVKSSSSVLTVEWRKVTSGTNSYSFQLKIYSTGDIEFCYGPMTLNSSLSVFVGMTSSATDIYRCGGTSWAEITRYTTGATTTRTIISTSHPYYDATTGKGSVYTFTQPACVKLNTLTAEALSSSSIKLDWTYNDAGVKYEIKYSTNASFDPETEGTPVNVTTGSALTYTVTGLSANTTYYFAVRKYCNATTPSGWMTTSATTDCGAFTAADLPIVDGFEDYTASSTATINRCWTKTYGYNGSHTSYPYPSTSQHHSGTKSLYFYSSSTASYRSWVAIPYSGAMNNICVNLWALKTSAAYGYLQVGVMSDPDDFSTFELVQDISFVSGSTSTWYSLEAYFDGYTGSGNYIVILAPSGAANYVYVDDITISTMPACRRITNLAVDDNLLLTWNGHGGNAYEVKYATADFDPTTEGTAIAVTTASYQLTGLESSTTYYVYVRSSCSDSWQRLVFTTPCTAMTLTIASPYTENFDNYTSNATSSSAPAGYPATHTMPLCWSFLNMSSSTSTYPQMFLTSYSSYAVSGKCLFFKSSSTTPAYAILPQFTNNIQSLQINYTYRNEGTTASNGTLYLGYMTDPTDASTFVAVQTCSRTTTKTNKEYMFSAAGVTGNNYYIAFRYTGGSSNNYYAAIDNVEVSVIPNCAKPVNLTASNITDHAATISWTETSATPATQWQLKYGEAGFNLASAGSSVIVNTTPSFTLTGLAMQGSYDVYVRAICGDGDTSAWSDVLTVTTICPTQVDVAIGTGTSTSSYIPTYTYYNYSLTEQIFDASELGGANNFSSISFEVSSGSSSNRNLTIWMAETTKSSFSSGTDWVAVDNTTMTQVFSGNVPFNTGWNTIEFDNIFAYSGTDNVIIIVDDNTGSYVSAPSFYCTSATSKAIRVYSDGTNYDPYSPSSYSGTVLSVRNNIVLSTPCIVACNSPKSLAVNAGATTANITWTDINTTTPANVILTYGPQGFDPAGNTGTTLTLAGGLTSYQLTGLSELTPYDVYLYYVCQGTDGLSDMVNASFTTTCSNPCHDTLVLVDSYGDGWNGNHLDMYVDGVLADSYSDETGSYSGPDTTIVVVNMCPGTIVDFVYMADGSYAGENLMTIINHDGEVIVDSYNGNSGSAILWEGRACFTPNCHVPNNLTADITYTTATLNWTETTTPAPTQWVLGYMSESDPAATYIAINTKPYTLTGLTPNTNYAFAVRAVCEPGVDSSDWSNTAYFYTGYCVPAPSSVDNQGMANIAFGDNMVVNTDTTLGLTYGDFTNLIGDAGQGTNAEVQITYATGYTYGTHIWVDWNNDLDFDDDGELVYTGLSTNDNPTTLAAIIAIPANAALGDYRMRVGGSDNDDGPDACYTGSWACLFDFTLRVTQAPTCYKPSALTASNVYGKQATLTWTENTPTPATQWQLAYTAYGETTYKYVNTNNYTLTGLIPESDYTNVMVRAICGAGDTSNWSNPISFTTTASCFAPTGLTASATVNSATLSWSENTLPTAATRWQVAYGTPGFDPDNEDEATYVETTNNTAFVLNGLHHSRSYQFYVRSLCGEGDTSYWSNVASATTLCGAWSYADMPLFEDFDGVTGTTTSTTSVLPNSCWSKINEGSDYYGRPQVYAGSSYAASGTNSMYFYAGTTDAYASNYAILPQMGFDVDTLNLNVSVRFGSASSVVTVGVMTDPEDATTFVPVTTIPAPSTGYGTHKEYEVSLADYTGTGRYVALAALKGTTTNNFYIDNLTLKLREKVNTLANNGGTLNICNEVVIPDTTGGNYANGVNATYVIKPANAGKMVHLTGTYDLENGYDFLNVYRGAVNANNLVGRYTGKGSIDYVSTSYNWVDSGYVTLVFTTDADNAFSYTGFHLLASCECPQPVADTVYPVVETNGTYTWINGQTYTNQSTTANAADNVRSVFYAQPNAGGCDSVYYVLDLVLHPTYTLTTDAEICERDTFDFYGQKFYTTGTYEVTLQSQYGADSVGVLNLQRHPAPTSGIYVNNRLVTTIADYCDNADLNLLARSNNNNVTFLWEDSSTAANRVVNPHESSTYTVVVKETVYGCTSTPASLTVTTVPVPELSISGDSVICFGQSATLTLANANNVDATYRWSNSATTNSITVSPTETTTYTVTATTTNASACTATASFTVTVNPLPVVTATASVGEICRDSVVTLVATEVVGYEYSWNTGATTAIATTAATTTGAYTVTVTDQNGCVNEFNTSTVTVYPSYELTDSLNVCYLNNPYTWGAQQITANGNYDQKFTIAHGCDSLVHLAFTFEQMGVENSNIERCYGSTYSFEGITRLATVDTNLTYTLNVGDIDLNGDTLECPKRYNLAVVVNPVKATTVPQVACDSYTWPVNNETYTTTGEYPVTLATTKGCDSVVTLNLTVNYKNTGVETVTACDNYVWDLNGVRYTASTNEPTFTLENQWGCDSVVTLNLTVNYRSYHEDYHCVSDTNIFVWDDGMTYNLNVALSDSIEYVTGTNEFGCNEIALLHLNLNPVSNVLNWTNVTVCDEYVIDTVSINESNCEGSLVTAYLRQSGDYQLRTRNSLTGQDELTRIHLTVNTSTYHTVPVTACVPYTWEVEVGRDTNDNPIYYEVGTYNPVGDTIVNFEMPEQYSNGCSNNQILRLTALHPTQATEYGSVCRTGSDSTRFYTAFNGQQFNGFDFELGEHSIALTTTTTDVNGCNYDSTLVLTVNQAYEDTVEVNLCEGMFTFDSASGLYTYTYKDTQFGNFVDFAYDGTFTFDSVYGPMNTATARVENTSINGCDSNINYFAVIYQAVRIDTVTEVACESYRWDLNDITYERSIFDSIRVDGEGTQGCEKWVYLNLTVNYAEEHFDTINVCTSYIGPDSVTYRETRTFERVVEGAASNGCDSVYYTTYKVNQTELIHQYVTSNRPYTWKNGQTFSQSIENVYFDEPSEGDCGNVYSLHLTIVDPITFCDDAFPYETGINGIEIDSNDIVMDNASFCLDNPWYTSVGYNDGAEVNWGIKFEANRPNDIYNVHGAQLYYKPLTDYSLVVSGDYTLKIYAGGENAPGSLIATKTVNFDANETEGWKTILLDNPVVVKEQPLWVTFSHINADGSANYPSTVVRYFDANDQNGAWMLSRIGGDLVWRHLNEDNPELFYSYMIKAVYSTNVWRNNDPNGNDTILYYTVNPTYNTTVDTSVCNSFVWDGTTYTETGLCTKQYTSVEGCDSVFNYNLTVRHSTDSTVNVTVCDTYTWADGNDSTYTVSGNYVYTTTNEAGCDSVVTLALTVNKNDGVEESATACVSYTWYRTNVTYTNNSDTAVVADYTVQYADANGCLGDSTLHLTLNPALYIRDTIVDNGGSYLFNGIYYTAPFDSTIIDTTVSVVTGCDSIHSLYLYLPVVQNIITDTVTACGTFEWRDGNTYEWMSYADRMSVGAALFKNVTTNSYVYSYPTDTVFFASGAIDSVFVLYLNLLEATYTDSTINVPLSLGTYTIYGIDSTINYLIDFTEYRNSLKDTIIETVLGLGSVYYCDNYVTFHINLFNNYDTVYNTICAEDTAYDWNNETYTVGIPGHTYTFEQVVNPGTIGELVHRNIVNQLAVNARTIIDTVCNSYTWDNTTYTVSGTDTKHYTTALGCDSAVTLNLTVKYSTYGSESAIACDSYKWTNNGTTNNYTATGVYTNSYTNAAGCPSTDTLHLTINNSVVTTIDTAVCNSFTWKAQNYTASTVIRDTLTAENTCDSIVVVNLTVNMPTSTTYTVADACDSYLWLATNGDTVNTYTVGGTYTYNYNTAAGCASIDTLVLTVNQSTNIDTTIVACDSYVWKDLTLEASIDTIYTYTNAAGCVSNDTLHVTINTNPGFDTTVVSCGDYLWNVNNRTYTTTGDYTITSNYGDPNGCSGSYVLHLTVNANSSYDSTLYISEGSYRYNNVLYAAPFDTTFVEHYTNAVNCDSTLNIHLHVGMAYFATENVINCNEYTWRDGNTYTWITPQERADSNALYFNSTTQRYVHYNPTFTVHHDGDYDSIYMLALTLTQSASSTDAVTLPISLVSVTYADSTFNFNAEAAQLQNFVNTTVTREVHIYNPLYCDSVVDLTINLVNNYSLIDTAHICVTETSHTWRGHTINTTTSDYDNVQTYYVYDTVGTGNETVVEYRTVIQHPIVYATERRTACDSYTWNGRTFTESTSRATFDTVNAYGCDSVVTLVLTIKHSSSTVSTLTECNSYTWIAANGDTVDTYTQGGDYWYNYNSVEGCPSTDTLHLTVNYKTNNAFTETVCDSYTWNNNGTSNDYTVTGVYTNSYTNEAGCPSVDTLYLTVKTKSTKTVAITECDSYTWTDGTGETYTASGLYNDTLTAKNGCDSIVTLNLTINVNSSTNYTVSNACNSYEWASNGETYTESGVYEYAYSDANGCASIDSLFLTVNYSTFNDTAVVACQTYTWHGTTYTNPSSVGDMYRTTATYAYYNANGCASVDTLHLTLGGGRTFGTETVTNCGPYTWVVNDEVVGVIAESVETSTSFLNPRTGCDSVVFLYLTINEQPVIEESATICDNELPYTWNDIVFNAAGEDTIHAPFTAQCDSVYHFTLTVNQTKTTALTDQICLGKDYTANGFNIAADDLATAGEYTFVNNLTSAAGCDSVVTLTLTVGDVINNPVEVTACDAYAWVAGDNETYNFTESGTYNSEAYLNEQGCTTVDVLTLTINNNSSRGYVQTICDSYMWNGTTYDSTGVYTYDYTDGNGCASTDTLTLTVNNSVFNTIEKIACDSFTWTDGNGETYTASGAYTYNYSTVDGCNGTDILVLTINTNSSTVYTVTACDSYTWNDETYATTGTYTFDYNDANGCASTDTLKLTVNYNSNTAYTETACDSYTWNGVEYTTSGDYYYSYVNSKGCESNDTLHLTVNYNTNSGETKTVCDSYTWNGTTYTQSGTYYSHYNTADGCASVDTLFLTVNTAATTTLNETACESYTWNVENYTQSGTYTQTFFAANGCDSIVTLNLTVNYGTNNAETTTACDSYTWNGTAFTTSGDYTFNYNAANGCASTDTLHLTINSSTTGTATAEACNYYVWNGTAYTQSGTYTQTLDAANGCDSVVTLNLTINTQVNNSIAATACGSYTWNGSVYTASGDYTQTFTSAAGCDSVVTLTLTIAPAITNTVNATACESYTWNGTTYATSGIYTNTYTAANGCDSIVTLSLTINQPVTSTVNATACDSYTWNGTTYTTSGTYTSTATAANGCDSVATLVLTINQAANTSFNATACDSYTWNGATYTTTGSYTQNFTTVNGCDSVVTLNLTITPAITTTVNATECSSYTWNGTTYTTSGIYTHTYTSAAGCDSTVTLVLTITPAINMTVPTTACDSYTWNGTTYTTSGNYTHTYTAVGGCDSVVTLALTINSSTTGTDNATACDSYTWNGTTYTASGNYTQTLTAANGCDSVVTMTLTINNSVATTDEQTACVSYTWNGIVYGATGSYTQTLDAANGCDSVVTLVLTINEPVYVTDVVEECDSYIWIDGINYTENTNLPTFTLTAANGCDSVITLNLTINHSVEIYDSILVLETQLPYDYFGNTITAEGDYVFNGTTVNGCDSSVYLHVDVQTVGINVVNSLENVTVYPNPTHGRVTISAEDVVKVEVLDIVGRLVATFENTNTFDISNLGEGAYTLRITLPDGTTVRKVVKK